MVGVLWMGQQTNIKAVDVCEALGRRRAIMNNVLIRELNFPLAVEGVTVTDANGDYNIYINANLSPAKKQKTLDHELCHIKCDHHYKDTPVAEDETEAQILSPITLFNEVLEKVI